MIFNEYRQQYDYIENNQIKSIGLKEINYKFDYTNNFIVGTKENISNRNMPQLKQFIIEKLEKPIESQIDFVNARRNVLKYAYDTKVAYLSLKNFNNLFNILFPELKLSNDSFFECYGCRIYFDSSVTDLEIRFELETYI